MRYDELTRVPVAGELNRLPTSRHHASVSMFDDDVCVRLLGRDTGAYHRIRHAEASLRQLPLKSKVLLID